VPDDKERAAMMDLIARLELLDENPDAETIQTEVYAAGKEHEFDSLRDWFKALYEVLFGDTQGPRFGSFVALYGVQETVVLIKNALEEKGPRPS
jgi:lysyl-tRNA synthetase class 1